MLLGYKFVDKTCTFCLDVNILLHASMLQKAKQNKNKQAKQNKQKP